MHRIPRHIQRIGEGPHSSLVMERLKMAEEENIASQGEPRDCTFELDDATWEGCGST